jgi:hypothetical protein
MRSLRRGGVVLGLLLLVASSASAQGWPLSLAPYVAVIVGQGSDLLTTIHQNPAHACFETNALLGVRPSVLRVAIPKLAIIGGVAVLLKFTASRESKAAKVIAKTAAFVAGAVGAKDGLHNYQTCGW